MYAGGGGGLSVLLGCCFFLFSLFLRICYLLVCYTHVFLYTCILTAMDKSADIPPLLYSCRSRAVILPSLVKPTLYLPRNGCLPPELSMSSFRSSMIRTGCCTLWGKVSGIHHVYITHAPKVLHYSAFINHMIAFLHTHTLTYLLAATAMTLDKKICRLSFPPKPPPEDILCILG